MPKSQSPRHPPEAIEAAAKAMWEAKHDRLGSGNYWDSMAEHAKARSLCREDAQAAIDAFALEVGLTVDNDDGHNTMYRLVSDWIPDASKEEG